MIETEKMIEFWRSTGKICGVCDQQSALGESSQNIFSNITQIQKQMKPSRKL